MACEYERVELGPPSSGCYEARKGSAAVGHKVGCFVVAARRADDDDDGDGGKTGRKSLWVAPVCVRIRNRELVQSFKYLAGCPGGNNQGHTLVKNDVSLIIPRKGP